MIRIKYAIKHLLLQWRCQPFKSVVAELYLVICFATILFSCGIYNNYLKTARELEANEEEKMLFIHLDDSDATIADLERFLSMLPDELVSSSDGMASLIFLNGRWQNIQYQYGGKQFTYPEVAMSNVIINDWLVSGRLYTEDEFAKGEHVILVPFVSEDGELRTTAEGSYTLNGEQYSIIGIVDISDVRVPITALPKDSMVGDIIIGYPYRITKSMYDTVVQYMNQCFDSARINEMEFSGSAERTQYQRIMILQVLLAFFSGIGVLILFAVHIRENEARYASLYLCGVSKIDALRIYVLHWWGMMIPSMAIAIVLFHYSAGGWMSRIYLYISDYACAKTYKVYLALIFCFMLFSISILEVYELARAQSREWVSNRL